MPVTLRALIAHSGDATEQRKFEPVRRALLARQREMMADPAVVRRALGRFETRLRRAAQRLEKWRIKFSDSGAIDDGFGESYRRARRAWRRANVDRSTSAFHAWRKRAKMHAYQQRLFRAAWPAMMRAWQIELTALTDLLGDEHDLAVLDGYLADVAVKRIEPTVIHALRHRIETQRDELRLQAAALGGRLFAEKASRVTRRLKIWWRLAA
jgi:CHAD domain-containing protein